MKIAKTIAIVIAFVTALLLVAFTTLGCLFPTPYYRALYESELPPALVYAVVKAESNFNEQAVSRAGAVGLMQILPSTAQFICQKEKIPYRESSLTQTEYNIHLGCAYLRYLLKRFSVEETALAAYNAGEGSVEEWLKREDCSKDGKTLFYIPYPETAHYVKKIKNFRKIYEIFVDKT